MSSETKPAKKNDSKQATSGPMGYLVGVAVALVVMVGIYALTRNDSAGLDAPESPHLAIAVEFDDLTDPDTRKALVKLHRDLEQEGLFLVGPLSYPLIAPLALGPDPGSEVKPKETYTGSLTGVKGNGEAEKTRLQTLRRAQKCLLSQPDQKAMDKVLPDLNRGNYLIPRVLTTTSAVIRLAPKGSASFSPKASEAIRKTLDAHKSKFKAMWTYSRSLGMTGEKDRAKINATFGVQLIMLPISSPDGKLHDAGVLQQIDERIYQLPATHPKIKCVATPSTFYRYLRAATARKQPGDGAPFTNQELAEFQLRVQAMGAKSSVSKDGKSAFVEIYTTAEGSDLQKVAKHVAKKLADIPEIEVQLTQ